MIYMCEACGKVGEAEEFPPAGKIWERLMPGDLFTDRECEACGALAYPTHEGYDELGDEDQNHPSIHRFSVQFVFDGVYDVLALESAQAERALMLHLEFGHFGANRVWCKQSDKSDIEVYELAVPGEEEAGKGGS